MGAYYCVQACDLLVCIGARFDDRAVQPSSGESLVVDVSMNRAHFFAVDGRQQNLSAAR